MLYPDAAISDLFDGSVNAQQMILQLDELIVERENRKVLLKLYNNRKMNRSGFRHFVETCGEWGSLSCLDNSINVYMWII